MLGCKIWGVPLQGRASLAPLQTPSWTWTCGDRWDRLQHLSSALVAPGVSLQAQGMTLLSPSTLHATPFLLLRPQAQLQIAAGPGCNYRGG